MLVNSVKNVKPEDVKVFLIEGTSLELLEKHVKNFKSLKPTIEKTMEVERFKGKKGEFIKLIDPITYIYSLGEPDKITEDVYREVSAKASAKLKKDKISKAVLIANTKYSRAITEGLLLGNYDFNKYRTKDKEEKFDVEAISILNGDQKDINIGSIVADAQIFSRNLVNEPGCVINPITLANIAKEECEKVGLEVHVYDEKWIQKQNMNGLWMVGKGSETPPRFIHIIYKPKKNKKNRKKLAVVGKGLTFDSGGLNIKTGDYMRTMKLDKSGACNTIAIMRAIAKLEPDVEVHGFIGAAENMPDGKAYRPDDIIVFRNGKTAEIDNTDAEGRVTLADVLSYASEQKPDVIIDMATLTGACVVALGEFTAGLFVNDQELGNTLLELSKKTGERLWQLPLDDDNLREKIKSPVADIKNTGGRYGGAITAAMFLQEFVGEGIKWAHLDIAGPAFTEKEYKYYSKGGTGFGVRTLIDYILNIK
mgnify:CR=1 FL=1|jgi:leucyl aminopeptidase